MATLGVLVLVGRKLGSTRAGLFAALALAIATVHVERSGIVGNEAPMTLAVLLAFLAALRYVERPDARRHALAGAAVGLAASLKYNAGTAAVTLLVATWIAVRRARADRGWRAWTAPSAFVGFPCAALAFLAGSPCVLVNPGAFWRDFTYQASLMERGFGPRALGWSFYPLHFADELSGIGVAVACAVGLAWTVERAVRGRAWALLLLAATLPTYLVLGPSVFSQMRFLLPAIPFVFLMGGLALDAAVERLPWRAGARALAFLLLTSLAVQPHARPLVAWARVHDRADPRAALAEWVHEHLDRDHPVFVAPSHLRVDVVPRVPPRGRLGRLDPDEAALYERRAAEAWTVRPLRSLLLEHATLDEFWAALTGGEETTVVCTAWAPRPAPPRADPVQEVGRLLRRLPALRQAAPYWGEALDRLLALPVEVSIVGRGRRDFLVAFRLR